jgi:hypothetical protein
MIFRTLFSIAALYAWGDPVLDHFRPPEIDGISRSVHQVFQPVVQKAKGVAEIYAVQYIPARLRYAHITHPMLAVGAGLEKGRL